jgi:nicotinamidase-related amidase
MKPALLVIDVQNEYFDLSQGCSDSLKSAIEYINAAIDLFRKKSLPIVVIQHKTEDRGFVPGKSGFDVPESVKLEPQERAHCEDLFKLFHKDRACRKTERTRG